MRCAYLQTEIGILQSESVLQQVIAKLSLATRLPAPPEKGRLAACRKAVAGIIRGEVVCGLEMHPEEVAHCVVVLGPVQTPHDHAAGVGWQPGAPVAPAP